MAIVFFDLYSFHHLISGFISFYSLQYVTHNSNLSFSIVNIIHFLVEYLEKNNCPNGKLIEGWKNHAGDIIFFFIGSFLALKLNSKIPLVKHNIFVRYLFILLSIYGLLKEIYREVINPYSTSILVDKGAFVSQNCNQNENNVNK